MEFGAGRRSRGVVLVITLGTGVGSAMFVDGRLVPNAELGHIPYQGASIERYMAESARERENLDWETWAGRLQEDRKSTRLNSSHVAISYAVFCLKKKTEHRQPESSSEP